jgi:hypothetical protein
VSLQIISFVGGQTKEGVFVGPDIINLIFDEDFLLTMTEVEIEVWITFKSVVTKFLGGTTRILTTLLLL